MADTESPPIKVADATPWVWETSGTVRSLVYEIRFYEFAEGKDELAQTLGTRTVSVAVLSQRTYGGPEADAVTHESSIENAPPTLITAGKLKVLHLGHGETRVKFTAALGTNPANATYYRILVNT